MRKFGLEQKHACRRLTAAVGRSSVVRGRANDAGLNAALRAETTKLTTEREILQRAAKYFAGETRW